jgi:hypothetical protein
MNQARYQKESLAQRKLLFQMAFHGTGDTPGYSGDVALALQLPHRLVKDRIEAFYPASHRTYRGKIWPIRHKRTRDTRQMSGYMLPLRAALQVLSPYLQADLFAAGEEHAAVIHATYGSGLYRDTLN